MMEWHGLPFLYDRKCAERMRRRRTGTFMENRKEADMQIGIIGAGKVGTTFGKYLRDHGGNVSGFYSRTADSAREAAEFSGTTYFDTIDALMDVSDTLFLATTDEAIAAVWDCIAEKNVKGKVICHFSGSLSSDVFSNWREKGVFVCSLHPIYAFSNKFTSYKNLSEAVFAVEGSKEALARMQGLFELLPNRVVAIGTEQKSRYHAALSTASNLVTGLIYMAVEMLKESGISEKDAYMLLKPLAENNVRAIFTEGADKTAAGCAAALTGPIERNDGSTVEKHLATLCGSRWEAPYRSVASVVTELAEKKNPQREYGKIRELLGGDSGWDFVSGD